MPGRKGLPFARTVCAAGDDDGAASGTGAAQQYRQVQRGGPHRCRVARRRGDYRERADGGDDAGQEPVWGGSSPASQ